LIIPSNITKKKKEKTKEQEI